MPATEPAITEHAAAFVAGTPFYLHELQAYASRLIDAVGFEVGDEVLVRCEHHEAAALVAVLEAEMNARGGVQLHVGQFEPTLSNTELRRTGKAMRRVVEAGGIVLSLGGLHEATLSDDALRASRPGAAYVDAHRKRKSISVELNSLMRQHRSLHRWCHAPWPSRSWAEVLFREADPATAHRKLGETLLRSIGAAEDFGPEQYRRHLTDLEQRAERLNVLGINELTILDSYGTALNLRVAEGARWVTPVMRDSAGRRFEANAPTCELYTTPDPGSVEGTFVASKPVMAEWTMSDEPIYTELGALDARGVFDAGRLTGLRGREEADDMILKFDFNDEAGTDRLGEIGLAVSSGPLAQGPPTFLHNNLDEQLGIHLGFGSSYAAQTGGVGTPQDGPHHDVVIGRPSTVVIGSGRNRDTLLIADGRWQI